MVSYSSIIKQAYSITLRHKVLWLFGFFVLGGVNLNFLHFGDVPAESVKQQLTAAELFQFFQLHPGTLAALSLGVLIFSFLILVVTNWSRIMLMLLVKDILQNKYPHLLQTMRSGRQLTLQVVQVSLMTTFFMVAVAAGLFIPPLFFVKSPEIQLVLLVGSAVLFLPLAFTISCLNIFTSFFVVLFRQPLGKAFNLSTDLFVSKWTEILGLSIVLGLIYSVSFFVGLAVIYVIRSFFALIFGTFDLFQILPDSAIIVIPKAISIAALWLLLAILNVFINTALLLLFFQTVTPLDVEEQKVSSPEAAPVVLT